MAWTLPTLGIILLTVCFTAAIALLGWPLARQARHYTDAAEQVMLAILCGNVLLFVLEIVVYLQRLPADILRFEVFSLLIACTGLFIVDWRRQRLAQMSGYLIPMLAWTALGLFTLAATVFLRAHGVPGFGFDWLEHYGRTAVFVDQIPLAKPQLGHWTMASRGPLFNAVAAALITCTGPTAYWAFSVASVVLNGQVILPMAWLLRRCAGKSMTTSLLLCLLALLFLPALHFNMVLTWAKLATTGFILTALVMILKGVDVRESRLIGWGVFALAGAFLTHFLTFLYAVLLLGSVVYYLTARKLPVRPVLVGTVIGAILVGSWMAILANAFGIRGIVTANSTLGDWGKVAYPASYVPTGPVSRLEFVGLNVATTVLPLPIRALPVFANTHLAPFRPGNDVVFAISNQQIVQTSTPGKTDPVAAIRYSDAAFGLTGLALLLAALVVAAKRWQQPSSRWRGFWIIFCTFGFVLNVAGTSWFSEDGCLYNNLQPYVCLAVVLVCSQLAHWPRWLGGLLAGAWLMECVVRVAYLVRFQTQRLEMFNSSRESLFSRSPVDANYLYNYTMKLKYGIIMLRDLFRDDQVWLVAVALIAAGLVCCLAIFRQSLRPVAQQQDGHVGV